ncbi:hypothetical protein QQS21_000654 [Conoideocrella luteorostrata]|uniref:Uncharacterized protein n=1 Tax=Conoideocrella luteorostrata TaxID=1105319 RepID=A0AAJ0CYK5_9HYPO|nr:hypothetical protein QQS21_000654 [Conoideocrella luteorostrata]
MELRTILFFFTIVCSAALGHQTYGSRLHWRHGKSIPDHFIVKLKSENDTTAVDRFTAANSITYSHKYSHSFHGFAARLSADQVEKLNNDSNVEFVEPDVAFLISTDMTINDAGTSNTTNPAVEADNAVENSPRMHTRARRPHGFETSPARSKTGRKALAQPHAPWNLARISHRRPGFSTYVYDIDAGTGTCVYVLDSGVDTDHRDFEGRASHSVRFWENDKNENHGTHVAGIIGSVKYGVAKNTQLFAIQVTDSVGRTSTAKMTAALDYILWEARHQSDRCPKGIVVNISLGVDHSPAINFATRKLIHKGYFVVVAAGNDASEVTSSPATEMLACTVGSTTRQDTISTDSNYGIEVDLFAPGQGITSTKAGGGYRIASGTSFAAPHVAGVGACLLAAGTSPVGLCSRITSMALRNAINLRGRNHETPNRLLNNGVSRR